MKNFISIISICLLFSTSAFSMALPEIWFATGDQYVSVEQDVVSIHVKIDYPTTQLIVVPFKVTKGNRRYHNLYDGEFIIEPGKRFGTISFNVFDIVTNNQLIEIELLSPQNARLGDTVMKHQVIVTPDSFEIPEVEFSVEQSSIDEGQSKQIDVRLNKVTQYTVNVPYKVYGTASYSSKDHSLKSEGVLTFVPGSNRSSLTLHTLEDDIDDAGETVIIELIAPVNNGKLGTKTVHTVTIN